MAEYISREKLLELYVDGKYDTADYRIPVPVIIQNIKDIPAADVRPVVTCGECIYFSLNSCMRWADGTFMERTDFCSRAAKREKK